jgi:hypothetical protein
MLMVSLGSGMAEEEGFGETSTYGVTCMETGEGLSFLLSGLFPATLLHEKMNVTLSRF